MELPEDLARVVVSFLTLPQMEMEHRIKKLQNVVKRLLRYSPEWLLQIGIKTAKTIKIHPEFQVLGKRLLLEKIEVDVTLQEQIMRVVHAGLFAQIERRLRQLQAMFIRKFYRGQDTFLFTRTEFNAHYTAIISHQCTNRIEDWGTR